MANSIDTVFVGGSLFTAGNVASQRGAVALSGGRIAAIGSDREIRELASASTEVIDISNQLLMPGFQDSHIHPIMAGVTMLQCDLHDAESFEETVDRIRVYVESHPNADWITGGGWSMGFFPGGTPTRHTLDAIVSDRPVFLPNRDGHGAWVNTHALEIAGISAATTDPADGRIEREPDGFPSGTLHEGAMGLVQRHVSKSSTADQYAGLLEAQRVLFSYGITGWQDAAVGEIFGEEDLLPVYLKAAAAGDLRARVVGALWWDRARGAEQIPDLIDRRAEATVGRFRGTSVKIMQDGVAENFTAAMTEPYLDECGCHTDNSGLSFVDPIALRGYVTQLDAAGFQVHFHSLGDRAVREALDAIEAALAANGPTDNRHHLAHIQVVHPEDIPRFARLNATANAQPLWAAHETQMDLLTIPFLGEPRSSWQYPFADLLRAGSRLAAGSDWPVSTAEPMQGIHVAVNRAGYGATGSDAEALYGHNALTLAEALTAYTLGSARVMHHDDVTGHLAEGAYADVIVLDRDPFASEQDLIGATQVSRTYVQGELVHSRQ
ncbi:MAG: amidohydrolase [Actinomycetes bacterium]